MKPHRLVPLLAAACACGAHALVCPEPPRQQQRDWDTQVRTEVGRIGPVRGAELALRVRNTTRDLLGKLPNADRLYLEQMMFASYCSALRDDAALGEAAKARQVLDYRRALQAAFAAVPASASAPRRKR